MYIHFSFSIRVKSSPCPPLILITLLSFHTGSVVFLWRPHALFASLFFPGTFCWQLQFLRLFIHL